MNARRRYKEKSFSFRPQNCFFSFKGSNRHGAEGKSKRSMANMKRNQNNTHKQKETLEQVRAIAKTQYEIEGLKREREWSLQKEGIGCDGIGRDWERVRHGKARPGKRRQRAMSMSYVSVFGECGRPLFLCIPVGPFGSVTPN